MLVALIAFVFFSNLSGMDRPGSGSDLDIEYISGPGDWDSKNDNFWSEKSGCGLQGYGADQGVPGISDQDLQGGIVAASYVAAVSDKDVGIILKATRVSKKAQRFAASVNSGAYGSSENKNEDRNFCGKCGKKFNSLHRHKINYHNAESNFKCDEAKCKIGGSPAYFSSRRDLDRHNGVYHSPGAGAGKTKVKSGDRRARGPIHKKRLTMPKSNQISDAVATEGKDKDVVVSAGTLSPFTSMPPERPKCLEPPSALDRFADVCSQLEKRS